MEPNSEQELKQLLDEGKITEEEYKDLLEALRQKEILKQTAVEVGHPKPQTNDWNKRMLVGFLIAFFIIMMAFLIKFIFGIGMLESLTISSPTVGLIALVTKGVFWLR